MMSLRETLEVLALHRGQRVVIPTMSSVAIWPQLSDGPLDFAYMPSAMGHGPGLALGLALAQPQHGVIVLNGDGSMLMNLGSLVTLAAHPAEVFLIVLNNGQYEVTGGQPTVGAGTVDYLTLARGAGFSRAVEFQSLEEWRDGAGAALTGPGPVFIHLVIEALSNQRTPAPPRPMTEQIQRLQTALGVPPRSAE